MEAGLGIAAGGALAGIASSLIGANASKEQTQAALAMQQSVLDRLNAIGIPSTEAQQLIIQNPDMVYKLAPAELQATYLQASQAQQVNANPDYTATQRQALDKLTQMSGAGLTDAEKLQQNQLFNDVASAAQARQGQIQQSMQERGMAGSGAELASKLGSAQQEQSQLSQNQMGLAANAQQRALQAMSQGSGLAGQMQQQQFAQQMQKAQAADAISQFNASMKANTNQQNWAAQNNAQAQNTAMAQQLENQRVANLNQQQAYNAGLIQQQFQNQLQKANPQAAAAQNMAGTLLQQGANKAAAWNTIGQGLSQTGAGVGEALIKYNPSSTTSNTATNSTNMPDWSKLYYNSNSGYAGV